LSRVFGKFIRKDFPVLDKENFYSMKRENSIKKMYSVQIDYYKDKMTDYYDTINQGKKNVIPSFQLAERIVEEQQRRGRFNQYGDLIANVG